MATSMPEDQLRRNTPVSGGPERGITFSFGTVTGFLIGTLGLYAGFFSRLLTITAALVDVLAFVLLSWILLPRMVARPRLWRSPVESTARAVAVAGITAVLALSMTIAAVKPPGTQPIASAETCFYDVSAANGAVPVPLIPNGSIVGHFSMSNARINAISVVAGLDDRTSDKTASHPLELRLDGPGYSDVLRADNITDNGLTRFNLRKPLELTSRSAKFTMKVVNASAEQVGIYVKVPDEADRAPGAGDGLLIVGHAGQEAPYENPDQALSGCVAGRQDRPSAT